MSRLRIPAEWSGILMPFISIGFPGSHFIFGGACFTAFKTAGYNGRSLPEPVLFAIAVHENARRLAVHPHVLCTYTLAGRIAGRHEFPATLPDGIIPLDIVVVNGDLVRKEILFSP
ncbi:MAG: hypothetical protein WCB46_04015 [Methanoregula sp.]